MASFGIQACAVELARETPLFDRALSVQLSNGVAGSSINAGITLTHHVDEDLYHLLCYSAR